MLITLLQSVGFLLILGSIVWVIKRLIPFMSDQRNNVPFPSLKGPIVCVLVGVVWLVAISTGSTHVDGTDAAVVENTVTGQFSVIGPGTHVFPMQPKLLPFVTRTTHYTMRRQNVEVGKQPEGKAFDKNLAVSADSNSPGRPPVHFWARVWAYPNQEMLIELHKRYGPDYLHNWIERVYIAALKSVQGKSDYFYVGQNRVGFQHDVEKALQNELLNGDDTPIVFVQQLAVVNFEFSDETNRFLQTVQKVEFDRQQAEQQIEVNKKTQEAEKIAAETSYLVQTREAERDRDAKKSRADGDAYAVLANYTAEAEGIRLVQEAISRSPAAYLEYQKTGKWDGKLPQYMLGGGVVPFVDITPGK